MTEADIVGVTEGLDDVLLVVEAVREIALRCFVTGMERCLGLLLPRDVFFIRGLLDSEAMGIYTTKDKTPFYLN